MVEEWVQQQMASINWGSGVITVPKTDLDLVQSTPTEIWNLDLNSFRLKLNDLEDDMEGMSFIDTHIHNTEVTLSGITFARVIEIVDPYTITFEDGQYAVNLIGANSNVGDRINVNQVSVRSQNSAGLITTQAIEFGEFGDAVTLDVINGVAGQVYPTGTRRKPSNNITDTVGIAAFYGFSAITCLVDTTFGTTNGIPDDIRGMQVSGVTHVNTSITVEESCLCLKTAFSDCEITGILDGDSEIRNCVVNGLTYFNGHIHDSYLKGEIILAGNLNANIEKCSILDFSNPPIINAGGSGQDLMMPNYSGILIIRNLTGDSNMGIGLDAGQIIIEDTCTAGVIQISGNGSVVDNSGDGCYVIDSIVNGTDVQNIQRLIETLRPHHTGTGNIWFWSPDLGNDTVNDGKHKDRAFKSWNRVNEHIIDNGHDIVMLIPDSTTGNTVITEKIVIDKNYVFLRGTGRDIQFDVPDINEAISIMGNGVELSGFRIKNALGKAISSSGLFTMVDNIWIKNCIDGINITGAYPVLQNTKINLISGYGINLNGNVSNGEITNCKIGGVGGNAIDIDLNTGFGGIVIKDTVAVRSSGYGITLSATTSKVMITNDCIIENNISGDINNLGTYNVDGSELGREIPQLKLINHCIYLDTELVSGGDGSQRHPFGNSSDAIDEAERLNIHHISISSNFDIDRDIKNFVITGIGTPIVDTGGYNLDGCEFNHCTMRGDYTGSIIVQESHLTYAFTLNGTFENCGMSSVFNIPNLGHANLVDCSSLVKDLVLPSIDLGGALGTASLVVTGQRGGLKLINSTQITDSAKFNMGTGNVLIDSSCTDGTIVASGIGTLTDSSIGEITIDAMIDSKDIHDLHAANFNKRDNISNVITIYEEDDITPRNLFDTNADTSVITPR